MADKNLAAEVEPQATKVQLVLDPADLAKKTEDKRERSVQGFLNFAFACLTSVLWNFIGMVLLFHKHQASNDAKLATTAGFGLCFIIMWYYLALIQNEICNGCANLVVLGLTYCLPIIAMISLDFTL
ncbi:Hypothetical predicted protein [Cloeon dipterum]|uniref:Transmembrane protein n=1 Tax=Cloeon dipterum TaxID=197152 RepID=A0A8S1E5T0_9INSE|nr:Hypothetical predicted protein [Cloeon dipterum]